MRAEPHVPTTAMSGSVGPVVVLAALEAARRCVGGVDGVGGGVGGVVLEGELADGATPLLLVSECASEIEWELPASRILSLLYTMLDGFPAAQSPAGFGSRTLGPTTK